jgi:type IV pilus assembly protein PilY1
MNMKPIFTALVVVILGISPAIATPPASPTTYTDNFTDIGTQLPWFFINGACMTAGTSSSVLPSGELPAPGCTGLPYYSTRHALFGGDTGTLPDVPSSVTCSVGGNCGGALRFTNWLSETGAILSNFNFPLSTSGLQVSFTTVTYEGDSGGGGGDGADGISFFLQDATAAADVGAFGGSLAYTCSNANNDGSLRSSGIPRGYDGLIGGYVGLGIDEYGNFDNQGDNTATGNGYQPGRIAMRGPGSIAWSALNAAYSTQYPSSLSNAQKATAVQYACSTGQFQDWSLVATGVATSPVAFTPPAANTLGDYTSLNYKLFGVKIANESATMRSQAIPITYNLKITTTGLLSLQYSYNGGAYQNVITSADVTQGNKYPLPANVRFGFAGSTGGSRNIHEVMCFSATPSNTSQSSAGLNQKQTAKVQEGTQVYFAFYNPLTLAGSLTSQYLVQDVTNPNNLSISSTINWDASCVLTGTAGGPCDFPNGPTVAQSAESPGYPTASSLTRNILSWSGTAGIPFQWGSLSASEQSALDSGDALSTPAPPTADARLKFLRGDRTNEQVAVTATTYTGVFRDRTSVLGDIIDSSPTWVGPPSAPYPNTWHDSLILPTPVMRENAGQTYGTFSSNATGGFLTRTNVVYAGANDGMLHAFESGHFDGTKTYQTANNDGNEVLAYVPGYIVNHIQSAAQLPLPAPQTGPTPTSTLDYSDPQYGHRFDVDAPPGTGDLFYGSPTGKWHSWLIGGLGQGGNAIYALDITDPSQFSEGNAASLVIGEWSTQQGATVAATSSTLNCVTDVSTSCGVNLGKTYGVPQIRRFHNGNWGAVFGNGYKSVTGDGGIYVMLVNSTNGAVTFYYLSTHIGNSTTPNGIYYTTPVDLDGDHITDYVYAGDLQGNVWRFDLTSATPATWASTNPTMVYSTGTLSQPISTKVAVASVAGTGNPRVIVEFGTGQQIPMTNTASAQYSTAQQSLYGIWDWNLSTWNSQSTAQYASLATGPDPVSGTTQLQVQTIGGPFPATSAGTGTDYRTITNNSVIWADQSGGTSYGWYLNLVHGNANQNDAADPATGNAQYANNPVVYEQVIFSPVLDAGAFIVNTTIPPTTSPTVCFSSLASGWTLAINPATGGAFTNSFFGDSNHNFLNVTSTNVVTGVTTTVPVSGLALSGTGTPSVVMAGTQNYLITQTVSGVGAIASINPPGGTKGSRLTWIEKR